MAKATTLPIRFSMKEIEALWMASKLILTGRQRLGDLGPTYDALFTAEEKLGKQLVGAVCWHCQEERAWAADGLGRRCWDARKKHGQLPGLGA